MTYYRFNTGGPFLAEDYLLAKPIERLLTRKLPLSLDESAAIYDPQETLTSVPMAHPLNRFLH